MKYTFNGESVTTYAEYIDVDKQSTLVAEVGGTYLISGAVGVTRPDEHGEHQPVELPVPPDDRWSPAKASAKPKQVNDEGTAG